MDMVWNNSLPLVTTRAELRSAIRDLRLRDKVTVGFVPTMGALHEGHGSLIKESKARGHYTVLSIFVNPKQFGVNEDFARYPRTLVEDIKLAQEFGCDLVFAPRLNEMYPEPFFSSVTVNARMTGVLCGAFRPGHFDGVTTVVLLLLNLVAPDEVFMGLKDFQQVAVIKKLCADLAHSAQVVGVPTVRASDGLALSSRNRYLSHEERLQARQIPSALRCVAVSYLSGQRHRDTLLNEARNHLQAFGLQVQYLELREALTLSEAPELLPEEALFPEHEAVLALAVWIGQTRLIDNVILSTQPQRLQMLQELIDKTLS